MTYSTTSAVPSALQGLTSVFGMGTGGTPALESPSNSVSLLGSNSIKKKFFDMSRRMTGEEKVANNEDAFGCTTKPAVQTI